MGEVQEGAAPRLTLHSCRPAAPSSPSGRKPGQEWAPLQLGRGPEEQEGTLEVRDWSGPRMFCQGSLLTGGGWAPQEVSWRSVWCALVAAMWVAQQKLRTHLAAAAKNFLEAKLGQRVASMCNKATHF